MTSVDISIKGLDETVRNLNAIATKKLINAIKSGLEQSSMYVLDKLNRNTPVDTGRLKSSNRILTLADDILIGPNLGIAPYARWVEYGHHTSSGSWVEGQHYVQKTATQTAPEVNKILRREIRRALK